MNIFRIGSIRQFIGCGRQSAAQGIADHRHRVGPNHWSRPSAGDKVERPAQQAHRAEFVAFLIIRQGVCLRNSGTLGRPQPNRSDYKLRGKRLE